MLDPHGHGHKQSRIHAPGWSPYTRIRVDSDMVKLLKALWKRGTITKYSCERWNEWQSDYNPHGHFTEDGKVQVVFLGDQEYLRDKAMAALRELLGVEALYPAGWHFYENYMGDLFVFFPRELLDKFNEVN